jgi:hypothetical protein
MNLPVGRCLATFTTELAPVPSVRSTSSSAYAIVETSPLPSGCAEMPLRVIEKPPFEKVPVSESEKPSGIGRAVISRGASCTVGRRDRRAAGLPEAGLGTGGGVSAMRARTVTRCFLKDVQS